MRVLIANLRLFYQCRGLWWLYALLAVFLGLGISMSFEWPILLLFSAGPLGLFAGELQLQVVSKPFAYGLPGREPAMRRFVLVVGVTGGLLALLAFRLGGGWAEACQLGSPVVFCSVFGAGLGLCLIAYGITILLGFTIGVLLLFVALLGAPDGYLEILGEVIVESPVWVIGVGAVVAGVAWVWIGLLRFRCLLCWDPWREDEEVSSGHSRVVERLERSRIFLWVMERCSRGGTSRYIWGTFYSTGLGSNWRSLVVGMLITGVVVSYVPETWGLFLISLAFIAAVQAVRLPTHMGVFPAGGRRERYVATMVLLTSVWGLYVAYVGLAVLGSSAVARVVPPVTFFGATLRPTPLDVRFFWVALVLPPAAMLVLVLHCLNGIAASVLMGAVIVAAVPVGIRFGPMLRTAHVLATSALLWLFVFALVRRLAKRGDLVTRRGD